MVSATTPDGIAAWTATDPGSFITESQTQASSIQAALSKRQRYTYQWASTAAQTAQTGMVEGSTGYRTDTKTQYIYENSTWRLFTPYAEFVSADVSVVNTTFVNAGAISIDTANSNSTSFVTSSGSNFITFSDPGIYAISVIAAMDTPAGATVSYVLASRSGTASNAAPQLGRGPFSMDSVAALSLSPVWLPSGSLNVWFYYRQNTSAARTMGCRIKVARLG